MRLLLLFITFISFIIIIFISFRIRDTKVLSTQQIKELVESKIPNTNVLEVVPLQGGISSDKKFLCKTNNQFYVVKCFDKTVEHTAFEIERTVLAAQKGLAPQVYFYDDTTIIMEFIPGKTVSFEQARDPMVISQIANSVRLIEGMGPVEQIKDLFKTIDNNFKKLDKNWPCYQMLEQAKNTILLLKKALESFGTSLVYCHGDLHARNIFLTEQGLKIIDWSDGGMCYPQYDLALFSVLSGLDNEHDLFLLKSYLNKNPSHDEARYFKILKSLFRIFDTLNLFIMLQEQKYVPEGIFSDKELSFYLKLWIDDLVDLSPEFLYKLAIGSLQVFLKDVQKLFKITAHS